MLKTKHLLLFALGISLLGSCKKDSLPSDSLAQEVPQAKQGFEYVPDLNSCYSGVSVVDGILKFDSRSDLLNTLSCLKSKTNEMDSVFLDDWGHLSDSLINDKADEISYHDELVYKAFEDNFLVLSLRTEMLSQEDDWLDLVPFDSTPSAMPNHIITESAIQTLFSPDGTINVDDTLLYIDTAGLQYYVLNGDHDILDSIVDGSWGEENSHVEIHYSDGSTSRATCKSTRSSSWKWKSSGRWAVRGKAGFFHMLWFKGWYSTTVSYKKKSGKWKRHKMIINSGVDSEINYNFNQAYPCGYQIVYPDDDSDKRTKKHTFSYGAGTPFRVFSGNHDTGHTTDKISIFYHTVTW